MTDPIIDLLFYVIIFCGLFMFAFIMLVIISRDFREAFLEDLRKK